MTNISTLFNTFCTLFDVNFRSILRSIFRCYILQYDDELRTVVHARHSAFSTFLINIWVFVKSKKRIFAHETLRAL